MAIKHKSDKVNNEVGPIAYGSLFRVINAYNKAWAIAGKHYKDRPLSASGPRALHYARDFQN